jgi:hypothetical protein
MENDPEKTPVVFIPSTAELLEGAARARKEEVRIEGEKAILFCRSYLLCILHELPEEHREIVIAISKGWE